MADGAFVADAIESFAPPDREIQELVTVSESTFRGLEPWLNAQCNHPKGQELMPRIRKEVRVYCDSLNLSIDIAFKSYGALDDAHILYGYFARAHELRPNELESTLADVREAVKKVKQDISNLVALLHTNRQGVIETCTALDNARNNVEKEREAHIEVQGEAKRSLISSTVMLFGRLIFDVVGRTDLMDEKGIIILLPTLITFADGAARQWNKYGEDIVARGKEVKNCSEAIQQLQSAAEDLHKLEDQATKVVNWWDDLDTKLSHTYQRMEDLRNNATLRLRMERIAKDFEQFKIKLREYTHSLTLIQDYYAPLLKSLPADA